MKQRGLSPVVATALLITIAVILASILFFWARGLLTEHNQKFGETIENACADVNFKAEAFGENISILNRGNVPIYALDIRSENTGQGSVIAIKTFRSKDGAKEVTIPQGSSAEISLVGYEIQTGNTLLIQPVLLGSKGGQSEVYVCEDKGLRITVAS